MVILNIFNSLWDQGCIPDEWNLAIVIPILKPNKIKGDPNSYRPISLTSPRLMK